MTEPTSERYVPTDADIRTNVLYNATRLVEEQIKLGVTFPNPDKQAVQYAETLYTFIKEGRTNG
jgi:hypothetical protein